MTVASLTLFPLLAGPLRDARVLAIHADTVFLEIEESEQPDLPDGPERYRPAVIVALQRPGADCLPNGLVLSEAAVGSLPILIDGAPVTPGPITFGFGFLSLAGKRWTILTWWNPAVPVLSLPDPAGIFPLPGIFNGLSGPLLGRLIGGPEQDSLAGGLAALSTGDAERAVRLLLGTGEGLIPAGDDVLSGALAALAAWAPESAARRTLANGVGDALDRTTPVSAALLRAAIAGRVAPPLTRLLRALGSSDLGAVHAAFDELARLKLSSGSAMAAGAVHQLGRLMAAVARPQL